MASKKNICVIGMVPEFTNGIAETLADKLDMFFANVNDLIEFDLIDVAETEIICGRDYLLKIEQKKVREVCTYENTVITMDYSVLNNDENIKTIKDNCLLIYVKLNRDNFLKKFRVGKKNDFNELLFNDRDFICTNIADVVADCNFLTQKESVELLIEEIKRYYIVNGSI